ncbi:MAG: citramalate synthase [Sphaerochaetaceae bacterium]|nr:citramalate synthase [Sphaerochaetaceae bacterium]
MRKVELFDSTLRDGSQAEGISFSVQDKLKIVSLLDELGLAYIEAGNPGSNPKDLEFFQFASRLELRHARLVAFGATRRRGISCVEDVNLTSLLGANTPVVAVFGKSWDFQVTEIIRTTLEENLAMIGDTVSYLKTAGREVIFDAEHFFDGYKSDPTYAMRCLRAAVDSGASTIVLCETRGGALPFEVYEATNAVVKEFGGNVRIGIHTHDDSGCAVASSLEAVRAGAVHVQGTLVGFGERCGNACLATVAADLELKLGIEALPAGSLEQLTRICRAVAEISNVRIPLSAPYIGRSAFSHKGGMHIDGVSKNPASFEHVEPSVVGNERRMLMSEVAGRALLLQRIHRVAPYLDKDDPRTKELMDTLKRLEAQGYQFEGAESSFELVIRKHLGHWRPYFELVHYQTTGVHPLADESDETHTAAVKVRVDGQSAITAAEGAGPVNALDKALRKVLEQFYPALKSVHLTDFKVRVLDSKSATASKVRVLIESTDGVRSWSTVGVSRDIIEASWLALSDSIEYKLIADGTIPPESCERREEPVETIQAI